MYLLATFAPVTPIRAQKLFMASAGNPRRLRADSVKRRGSSQSLQIPANDIRGGFHGFKHYDNLYN